MRLYYFFGSLLRPFGIIGLHAYSYITRTARARLVVQNEEHEVLLVQTWLGGGKWGLPGGGVDRGENAKQAALRELREETGIVAELEDVHVLRTIRSAGHDEVLFSLSTPASSLPDHLPNQFEIKDAAWFSLSNLPRLEPLAKRIINQIVKGQ